MSHTNDAPTRVLAIASPGNCWVELHKVTAAFSNAQISFATSLEQKILNDQDLPFAEIIDFTLYSIWKLPLSFAQVFKLILRTRPQWIISTGGAPGLLAIIIGRILGARCIWVESLDNSQEISMSGKIAGLFAQTWLTQWEHLSKTNGPHFKGALL